MRLAIVGMSKWGRWWHEPAAEGIIQHVLERYYERIDVVISGAAPGVDTMARTVAERMGLEVIEHEPKNLRWEPEGFKERNILIAEDCTDLLAIRWADSNTYGSGFTADRAEELGKKVQRIELP